MFRPKVGLIGTGKWGSILKEKLIKNSNLVFFANSKSNYKKKIKEVEWIFIATPDKTHFKIVKNFLNLKKNVFCEKPLSLNYKSSKYLFDLAKKKGVKLYVDDIQTFFKKKIKFKKDNIIIRKKLGKGSPKNLLYRFAYHDFYFLENKIKTKRIKLIEILDTNRDLKFNITFKDNSVFRFFYSLNSQDKIHKINNTNFITKKDLLTIMIKKVLKKNVNFKNNMKISLFSNKMIDKIQKKF